MSPFLCLPSPPSLLFVSGEAVFARCLSSLKEERVEASRSLSGPQGVKFSGDKAAFLEDMRKVKHLKMNPRSPVAEQLSSDVKVLCLFLQALYASKIISYAQGFMLLRQAAKEFGWSLNYGAIALMWRGGCIIRRYGPSMPPRGPLCSIPACYHASLTPMVKHALKFRSNFLREKSSHPNLHCSNKALLLVHFLIFFFFATI